MSKLRISPDLALPLEAVTQTFALLAKRGSGKTYTAAVMIEEMATAALPVAVLDPVGVLWGLRASADGKGPGLPVVILGGEHGDVPLESTAGSVIADFVIDARRPVVLDLSLFRKGEQARFVTDFAERLYHKNREPLHLVIDEADLFAPQRPMPGEQRMLGAMEDIVRRGRARGLGVTLITQRPAVLHKDVLTQVEVLVALRLIAPQDRAAVDAWVKVHGTPEQRDQLMASLPSLPIGTAWFWSPGWLDVFKKVTIRKRTTFDSSATPTMGAKAGAPKHLAPVELDDLRARIASTIEKAKADDPKALRARIAELEREVKAKPQPAPPEPKVKNVEVPVISKGQEVLIKRLENQLARSANDLHVLAEAAAKLEQRPPAVVVNGHQRTKAPVPPPAKSSPVVKTAKRQPLAPTNGSTDVGNSGLRRMLIALAQRPHGLTNRQLGVRAGVSSKSGTFATYLGKARSNGWVENRGDARIITPAGERALGGFEPLPAGRELLDYWLGELGQSGAARILRVLADAHPDALDNATIGERANISPASGTFATYVGKLRSLELIEGGRGQLRASAEFFE